MDDCFIITKSEKIILTLFDKFNNVHKAISFTKQTDINNQLQFLDVLINKRWDKFLLQNIENQLSQVDIWAFSHIVVKEEKINRKIN